MNFTILSAGPSFWGVRKSDLLDGPVVAINAAILAIDWLDIDVDLPSDLPGIDGVQVWGRKRYQRSWRKAGVGREQMVWLPPWKSGVCPSCIVHAINKCVSLGATHIKVLGCDMRGGGSACRGFTKEEEPWQRRRWRVEAIMLRACIAYAEGAGCVVDLPVDLDAVQFGLAALKGDAR
jgi:hypothetical protein